MSLSIHILMLVEEMKWLICCKFGWVDSSASCVGLIDKWLVSFLQCFSHSLTHSIVVVSLVSVLLLVLFIDLVIEVSLFLLAIVLQSVLHRAVTGVVSYEADCSLLNRVFDLLYNIRHCVDYVLNSEMWNVVLTCTQTLIALQSLVEVWFKVDTLIDVLDLKSFISLLCVWWEEAYQVGGVVSLNRMILIHISISSSTSAHRTDSHDISTTIWSPSDPTPLTHCHAHWMRRDAVVSHWWHCSCVYW